MLMTFPLSILKAKRKLLRFLFIIYTFPKLTASLGTSFFLNLYLILLILYPYKNFIYIFY